MMTELYREYIYLKRYFFDNLSSMISIYIVFLAMFFGLKHFGGSFVDAQNLDMVIIGYFLWTFAAITYSDIAYNLMTESQLGTLEQLYLSPAKFDKRMLCRIIASYISSFIFTLFILYLTMLTTGRWITIPWIKVFMVLTLSLLSMSGIGYIMGGLAIVFKRMASVLGILQFAFILLVSLDAYPINGFSFLPYAAGANTIIHLVIDKATIPVWWYGFIALNSLTYFFMGTAIYKLFEMRAMRLNLLSEY